MDTAQRIAATRSRLRELQLDEHKAKRMGPACIQCVHYAPSETKPVAYCNHIALVDRKLVVTTGEFSEHQHVTAEDARSENGLCGPEALLFQMNWWAVGKIRLDRAVSWAGTAFMVAVAVAVAGIEVGHWLGLVGHTP